MKTSRLIIGIVSILMSLFIIFQSCAAGLSNALSNSNDIGASSGIILFICFLTAGIIGVVCKNKKVGTIVAGGFHLLGGIIGLCSIGSDFSDLVVWGVIALVFALALIIPAIFIKPKELNDKD